MASGTSPTNKLNSYDTSFVTVCSTQVRFSPQNMSTAAGWFGFLKGPLFTIVRSAGLIHVLIAMTVLVSH